MKSERKTGRRKWQLSPFMEASKKESDMIEFLNKEDGKAVSSYFDTDKKILEYMFLDSLFKGNEKYITMKMGQVTEMINDPSLCENDIEWAKTHLAMLEKIMKSLEDGNASIMLNIMPEYNFKVLFADLVQIMKVVDKSKDYT